MFLLHSLRKFLKNEPKPIIIILYAPWRRFSQTSKSKCVAAPAEVQRYPAIDIYRPEIRSHYNRNGIPVWLQFYNGIEKFHNEIDGIQNAIASLMKNPEFLNMQVSDIGNEIKQLPPANCEPVIQEEVSVMVMFCEPICDHCKQMKSEYDKAVAILKNESVPGIFAALDTLKQQMTASGYFVKEFSTVKYFCGDSNVNTNARVAPQMIEFVHPRKPPSPPIGKRWTDEETAVVHLNKKDFKQFVKKRKHVLVMFYIPWCGHCRRAKPEFIKAAERYKDDPYVDFAAVDCSTEKSLCNDQGVKGYPTIKYFGYYSRVVRPYNGGRTEADFIKFMKNPEFANHIRNKQKIEWRVDSPNILQLTDDTFNSAIRSDEPVMVLFYAPWCEHCKKLKPNYIKAAEELKAEGVRGQMAMLDCTVHTQTADEYEISGFPTIKLFKNGKLVGDYDGRRTPADLIRFIKNEGNKVEKEEEDDDEP